MRSNRSSKIMQIVISITFTIMSKAYSLEMSIKLYDLSGQQTKSFMWSSGIRKWLIAELGWTNKSTCSKGNYGTIHSIEVWLSETCPYRIISAVLGEAEDVNMGLLREKIMVIQLKMKITCFHVTLGRWVSWGGKISGHEERHWKWKISRYLEEWDFGTA